MTTLATAVTVVSTLAIAYAEQQSSMRLVISLAQVGLFLMIVGSFSNKFEPNSKLGWIVIVFGFNFFCGWLLSWFDPLRLYFGSLDSTGFIFLFLLFVIGVNSWQMFYHIDQYFYLRKIWGNKRNDDSR